MDFVFTITQGGPGTDSTIIPYQIYLTMFRKYEYGEAAAAGVIVIILTIILSNFALRLTRDLLDSEK
jgi:sorbitol/mannitol transport system permease protein